MGKQVDTSGLNTELVISQAKPSNRKSGNPSGTPEPETATEAIPEKMPELPHVEIVPPPAEPEAAKEKDVPREENRRRRGKTKPESQDYESLFIRTAPSTTRSGKAVYIRKEFHDRIMRIVQNIGFNELSLFSYIDNVLEHHFETYQEDISDLYRKRIPNDIF